MMLTRKNLRRTEEGFSIIEILVVILILGVLAAVALGLYNNSKKYAIRAGVYQDIKHTEIEIATWLAQTKPVLGDASNGGQTISVSKTGNSPAVDITGTQFLPVAAKLNIPVSDSKTTIRVLVDGMNSTPQAGHYDVTIIAQNNTVGGLSS